MGTYPCSKVMIAVENCCLNGLIFAFSALSNDLLNFGCNITHPSKSILKMTSFISVVCALLHLKVSINHVDRAVSSSLFPPVCEWNSVLFIHKYCSSSLIDTCSLRMASVFERKRPQLWPHWSFYWFFLFPACCISLPTGISFGTFKEIWVNN